MFSCARPENDEMMRKPASARSSITLSDSPGGIGASIAATRSLSARQASGEKRSRITEAAYRASVTICGSEPPNSPRVSAARAIRTAFAFGDFVFADAPRFEQRADAGDERARRPGRLR